jgi:PhoPQ-activated pathogenicity-related protein
MVIKDNRGQFLDRPTKTEKAAMLEVGVVPNQYRIENDDRGGEVE